MVCHWSPKRSHPIGVGCTLVFRRQSLRSLTAITGDEMQWVGKKNNFPWTPCTACPGKVVFSTKYEHTFTPIGLMKVPDLEEQKGRNIYLFLSKYLFTAMLLWMTPSPYKEKLLTLYGPMTSPKLKFDPITTNSGVIRETAYISIFWSSSIQDGLSRSPFLKDL